MPVSRAGNVAGTKWVDGGREEKVVERVGRCVGGGREGGEGGGESG